MLGALRRITVGMERIPKPNLAMDMPENMVYTI